MESIPPNFSLQLAPAPPTYAVLTGVVRDARHTLDVSVMYWNPLAAADDDTTTGHGRVRRVRLRGVGLYDAMLDAVCERGKAGASCRTTPYTSLSSQEELQDLAQAARPTAAAPWWCAAGTPGLVRRRHVR